LWDFDGGSTSDLEEPTYTFSTSGNHTVTLVAASAFDSDTLIKQVYIYPVPAPDFSADGICEGEETIIENLTSTDGLNITSWHWNFGDARESEVRNPGSHDYLNSGDYNITLSATTADGCKDSIQKSITIADALPKPDLYSRGPVVYYLACSNDSADYYKWCCNGKLIDGATNFIYVANRKYGIYYVSISNNDLCYTKSDSVGIPTGYTGIEDIDPFAEMKVYPNPTSGLITIEMDNILFGDMDLSVISQTGKEILSNKLEKITEYFLFYIDLSNQAEGLYIINLKIDKYITTRKIILE